MTACYSHRDKVLKLLVELLGSASKDVVVSTLRLTHLLMLKYEWRVSFATEGGVKAILSCMQEFSGVVHVQQLALAVRKLLFVAHLPLCCEMIPDWLLPLSDSEGHHGRQQTRPAQRRQQPAALRVRHPDDAGDLCQHRLGHTRGIQRPAGRHSGRHRPHADHKRVSDFWVGEYS